MRILTHFHAVRRSPGGINLFSSVGLSGYEFRATLLPDGPAVVSHSRPSPNGIEITCGERSHGDETENPSAGYRGRPRGRNRPHGAFHFASCIRIRTGANVFRVGFAIDRRAIEAARIGVSDLRWLIKKRFADHAYDQTSTGVTRRKSLDPPVSPARCKS